MKLRLLLLIICSLMPGVLLAQGRFTITLLVDDSSAFRAYHNEPIVFTITLVNKTLQQDISWNEDADAYLAQVAADYKAGLITKDDFEIETNLVTSGKRITNAESVGSADSPWFRQLKFVVVVKDTIEQHNWKPQILGDPGTDTVALLDEKGYYSVDYGLSPQQVSKLRPGSYKVQVMLAGVLSNEVSVKIKPENIPNGQLNKKDMLLRLGNYYLEAEDAKKALSYANILLQKNPSDISGLVLKGEAYILQQQYKTALTTFTKAYQIYNKVNKPSPANEQPLYLIATIAWLQKRQ
jgi:tetratricopeptide (TPR) repeat protein